MPGRETNWSLRLDAPVNSQRSGHENRRATNQGFPANRLNEPIDDLSNQFSPHFGAPNHSRISIHACLPCTALTKHGRDSIRPAQVRLILCCTVRYLLHDVYKRPSTTFARLERIKVLTHRILRDSLLHIPLHRQDELHQQIEKQEDQS